MNKLNVNNVKTKEENSYNEEKGCFTLLANNLFCCFGRKVNNESILSNFQTQEQAGISKQTKEIEFGKRQWF